MIIKAEREIADVTKQVITNVESTIDILEKVQINKSAYSSKKLFNLLGEISHQIAHVPDGPDTLIAPCQQKNLRLDSHMSVFNVERKQQVPRGRSLTKVNRLRKLTSMCQQDNKFIKKRRITTFNKIISLDNKHITYDEPISNDDQRKQDQLRQQLQKSKLQCQKQRKIILQPKFLSARQLKQKFSYGYDFDRIKVKGEQRSNLILSSKSLLAQLSKKIQKKDLPYKVKKPETSFTDVKKVVQKKKKLPNIKKNKVLTIQDLPPPQHSFMQFSAIKSLTDKLNCQEGINFTFQDRVITYRAKSTTDKSQQKRRYSKLDYEIMKRRSKTSMSQYTNILNKDLTPQKSRDLSTQRQQQLNLSSRICSSLSKKQNNIKMAKIYVGNEHLKQYLLMDEFQNNQPKLMVPGTSNESQKSTITLNKNDEYNLKYIKGIISSPKDNQSLLQKSLLPLTPKQPVTKIPYLKTREKIQNRNSIINEIKKKFEQTLRNRQKILSKEPQSSVL